MKSAEWLEKRVNLILALCDAVIDHQPDATTEYIQKRKQLDDSVDEQIPFIRLVHDFKLSPFEADVLFFGLMPILDAGFKQKICALHQNFAITQPDVGTALMLFSASFADKIEHRRSFLPGSPLISGHLCDFQSKFGAESQLQEMTISVPPRIVSIILDQDTDVILNGFSRLIWPETSMDQVMLNERHKSQILSIVDQYERCLELKKSWDFNEIGDGGRNIILLFSGPSGTGKTLMSQAIANRIGRPLLLVDANALSSGRTLENDLDKLMREARLQRAILLFDDCELLFSSRLQGNRDLPMLLAALDAYEGLIILTTNLPTTLDSALDRRVTLHIDFEIPPAKLREQIWKLHLPEQLKLSDDVDFPLLAEKYEFSGGTIRNAIAVAMNHALSDAAANHTDLIVSMNMLNDAAKAQIRNRIKKLADKTVTTLTLDALVLPRKIKDQINSLIASVRNRRIIFEDWGFGERITKGRGICALFRGDSGTGKTLSAEIIANELGMTLYRVRIPAIVSKYVGETEKNLEKCFREAATSGALLLFDEADSIFSKRTEVQNSNDRYSNMEVNLLLQEVERFEGVVILTTNLDAAIDDAFERRLNHKIDFPFPDEKDRAKIWKRLLPASAPLGDDIDFEILGKDLELSGGCIKNSVLRAAYRAAERKIPIDMDLLEAAGLQEYREMGKLVPMKRNPWD